VERETVVSSEAEFEVWLRLALDFERKHWRQRHNLVPLRKMVVNKRQRIKAKRATASPNAHSLHIGH
jgi:hypothetical protein